MLSLQMALATVKLFGISGGLEHGLFYVSCVPGGGFGYLATILVDSRDSNGQCHAKSFSAAVNFVCVILVLGKEVQYCTCDYLESSTNLYKL